ncbi:MAG: DNA repair protein RecO [Muribaculaceae bacterium]|nr:DNA repair protein RecO [Muribaculaceae bacterium]
MAVERLIGIVTDVLKHSDRHDVVSLYTRSHGRVALLAPAGNGKAARARRAAMMQLSVIETDVKFNANRDLQFLGRFSRPVLWRTIYFDPVKSAVAIFISEFLNQFLRQSPPDPQLFDFLVGAIDRLDKMERGVANFHLGFLVEFLDYAGIRPDLSDWQAGCWFDLRGGVASMLPPGHRDVIEPRNTAGLPILARMTTANAATFKFNGLQRRQFMSELLKYYAVHFPGIGSLKSPEILAEVFS